MKKCLRLCFKVDKSLALAVDDEGNPVDSYVCHIVEGVNTYTVARNKYKELVEDGRKLLASIFACDVENLVPITLNEYLDNTNDKEVTE